jgi:hypothetical protein
LGVMGDRADHVSSRSCGLIGEIIIVELAGETLERSGAKPGHRGFLP